MPFEGGTGDEMVNYRRPDWDVGAEDGSAGGGSHFKGCIRNFRANNKWYPLNEETGWKGWDVSDCDGTACGGEVCLNEGTCSLDRSASEGYSCECQEPFAGDRCEAHRDCAGADGCKNGGQCEVLGEGLEVACSCDLGFAGEKCEEGED